MPYRSSFYYTVHHLVKYIVWISKIYLYLCVNKNLKTMENTMKTFKDLEFKDHPIGNGVQAMMDFDNNYGVSVVKFNGSYGYPHLWEVAIMYKGRLNYQTPITDDVLGHQDENDVSDIMRRVQQLKKK